MGLVKLMEFALFFIVLVVIVGYAYACYAKDKSEDFDSEFYPTPTLISVFVMLAINVTWAIVATRNGN